MSDDDDDGCAMYIEVVTKLRIVAVGHQTSFSTELFCLIISSLRSYCRDE